MKSSTLARIIGVIILVFGAEGFVNSLFGVYLAVHTELQSKMNMLSGNFQMYYVLSLIAPFADGLYLSAGIFLMMRKKLAPVLAYIALSTSIAYVVIPMFLEPLENIPDVFGYGFYPLKLIGPGIDLLLLYGVYTLRHEFQPESASAAAQALVRPVALWLRWLSIVLLLVPALILVLYFWINLSNPELSGGEKAALFDTYLPDFLKGGYPMAYLGLFFSLAAVTGHSFCLGRSSGTWKTVHLLLLILSALLVFIFMFPLL